MTKCNKIFQIGFNKCGTVSLNKLFLTYSNPIISSTHWNYGYLAYSIHCNIQTGNFLPLNDYNYHAYFDMECFIQENDSIQYIPIFQNYFDLLDINYPNSIFILNTRNIDNWIESRLNHYSSFSPIINNIVYRTKEPIKYVDLFKAVLKTENVKDITDLWKQNWIDHHENILEYFSFRENHLLVYDIEKDDISKIKTFFQNLDITFITDKFPHEHKTTTKNIL